MKVTLSDVDVLKHLQPEAVEAYLQATGWQIKNRIPDRVSIWTRDAFAEDRLKIQVPLDREFDDYPLRISELLNILEKAENRSQIDIISELITNAPNITVQGVVMQIKTPNPDKLSGEVILLGVVVDRLRKIDIELVEQDYIIAIKAYQERCPIICTGDLIKDNKNFMLKNPRKFNIDQTWQN